MLENSVWRQYHKDNSFRQILSEFYEVDPDEIINDDKELYGVLKAKLTKKELKLFTMDSADINDNDIKTAFSLNDEELKKAKYKLYKKMKQDKMRYGLRASANTYKED